jgi:hypothetical protein
VKIYPQYFVDHRKDLQKLLMVEEAFQEQSFSSKGFH